MQVDLTKDFRTCDVDAAEAKTLLTVAKASKATETFELSICAISSAQADLATDSKTCDGGDADEVQTPHFTVAEMLKESLGHAAQDQRSRHSWRSSSACLPPESVVGNFPA